MRVRGVQAGLEGPLRSQVCPRLQVSCFFPSGPSPLLNLPQGPVCNDAVHGPSRRWEQHKGSCHTRMQAWGSALVLWLQAAHAFVSRRCFCSKSSIQAHVIRPSSSPRQAPAHAMQLRPLANAPQQRKTTFAKSVTAEGQPWLRAQEGTDLQAFGVYSTGEGCLQLCAALPPCHPAALPARTLLMCNRSAQLCTAQHSTCFAEPNVWSPQCISTCPHKPHPAHTAQHSAHRKTAVRHGTAQHCNTSAAVIEICQITGDQPSR